MWKRIYWFITCFFAVLLFCQNEYYCSFSGNPEGFAIQRMFLKFGISFLAVLVALIGFYSCRSRMNFFILAGLILSCIGDMVINANLVVGAMVFLMGHIFFIKGFIAFKAPPKQIFVVWAFLMVILISGIVLMKCFVVPDFDFLLVAAGIIYVIFMTAMVSFSFVAPRQICIGGLIFGISDILLMCNMVFGTTPLSHIISLGAYYIGVFIIADYVFKGKHSSFSD